MHQIRETLTLVDQLEALARTDELSPSRFELITARVVARCSDLVAWAQAASHREGAMVAAGHVDKVATLLTRMQILHGAGLLEPVVFEASLATMRRLLGAIDAWAGSAHAAVETARREPRGFDDITGLPLCSVRFVDRGPRHFGVIEGGRA